MADMFPFPPTTKEAKYEEENKLCHFVLVMSFAAQYRLMVSCPRPTFPAVNHEIKATKR